MDTELHPESRRMVELGLQIRRQEGLGLQTQTEVEVRW